MGIRDSERSRLPEVVSFERFDRGEKSEIFGKSPEKWRETSDFNPSFGEHGPFCLDSHGMTLISEDGKPHF